MELARVGSGRVSPDIIDAPYIGQANRLEEKKKSPPSVVAGSPSVASGSSSVTTASPSALLGKPSFAITSSGISTFNEPSPGSPRPSTPTLKQLIDSGTLRQHVSGPPSALASVLFGTKLNPDSPHFALLNRMLMREQENCARALGLPFPGASTIPPPSAASPSITGC